MMHSFLCFALLVQRAVGVLRWAYLLGLGDFRPLLFYLGDSFFDLYWDL